MATSFLDFINLLEEEPKTAFFSRPELQQGGGFSPRQRRTFRDSFGQIQDQFLGALGAQLRSGQTPDLGFDQFLSGSQVPSQDPFSFLNFFQQQNPFSGNIGRFNPRTRQLFDF